MSGDLRFVFVSPVLPLPADQGSRLFQLDAARTLAELGPVTWITRTLGDQRAAEQRLRSEGFELDLDRTFEARGPVSRLLRRVRIDLTARRRDEPREIHFVSSPGVISRVRAQARRDRDAWYVGAYWTTVRALAAAPPGRRVLLAADVESRAARDAANFRSTAGVGTDRLVRAEREAFRGVDRLLCLTAEDERDAADLVGTTSRAPRIDRWPARLAVPEACPSRGPLDPLGGRFLVYGHWHADFNRDGLRWFVQSIWTTIRRLRPHARLRVVGRGANDEALGGEGVERIGYVEDLRTEIDACDAVLIPLRFAGGLRYRLIEALGHGRPVVCTPVAARGAEARAGTTHLEAESPAEWTRALDELGSAERLDALVDTGRRWAVETYGHESGRQRLAALFTDEGSPT